jgi:hypothetical protein
MLVWKSFRYRSHLWSRLNPSQRKCLIVPKLPPHPLLKTLYPPVPHPLLSPARRDPLSNGQDGLRRRAGMKATSLHLKDPVKLVPQSARRPVPSNEQAPSLRERERNVTFAGRALGDLQTFRGTGPPASSTQEGRHERTCVRSVGNFFQVTQSHVWQGSVIHSCYPQSVRMPSNATLRPKPVVPNERRVMMKTRTCRSHSLCSGAPDPPFIIPPKNRGLVPYYFSIFVAFNVNIQSVIYRVLVHTLPCTVHTVLSPLFVTIPKP